MAQLSTSWVPAWPNCPPWWTQNLPSWYSSVWKGIGWTSCHWVLLEWTSLRSSLIAPTAWLPIIVMLIPESTSYGGAVENLLGGFCCIIYECIPEAQGEPTEVHWTKRTLLWLTSKHSLMLNNPIRLWAICCCGAWRGPQSREFFLPHLRDELCTSVGGHYVWYPKSRNPANHKCLCNSTCIFVSFSGIASGLSSYPLLSICNWI